MRWPWQRRPAPPENVVVELQDGTLIGPVPLRYQGRGGCGMHHWVALVDYAVADEVAAIKVETVPARTHLAVAFLPTEMLAEMLEQRR